MDVVKVVKCFFQDLRRLHGAGSYLLLFALLVCGANRVVAQDGDGGIPVGPVTVYPAIGLAVSHDDNLFSSRSNEVAVWQSLVSPSVRVEAKGGNGTYAVTVRSDIGRYRHNSADDFEDYGINAEADLDLNRQHRLKLIDGASQLHDPRGTGRTAGTAGAAVADEYREFDVGAKYSFGADDAFARLEFEAGHKAKRYINNRASTAIRDRDNSDLSGTFLYEVMPNTSVLAQLTHTNVAYRHDTPGTPSLDSAENQYLIGVTWEATLQTTGTFKIGRLDKDFDDPGRRDFSVSNWELSVQWQPLRFSTFNFSSGRSTAESDGTGDFTLSDRYAANWTHGWLDRLSTTVNLSFTDDEFRASTRVDDIFDFGARVDYQFRQWLSLGAGYTYTDKDSNDDTFDFQRNKWLLNLNASF